MSRPTRKQALALGLALTAGAGVGVGTAGLWSASGSTAPLAYRADVLPQDRPGTSSSSPSSQSSSSPSSASSGPAAPLTLEQATAIATEVAAPGRVVEWDEDREPTGLRYDVTLLHDDGTSTQVEVDTVTGQVTSIDHDNDYWD